MHTTIIVYEVLSVNIRNYFLLSSFLQIIPHKQDCEINKIINQENKLRINLFFRS